MSTRPLCLFHADCDDGFAAAWVVRRALGDVEFIPVEYKNPPPDVTDRDVLIVDFSYKNAVLKQMAAYARTIVILDHHKSAKEELSMLMIPGAGWRETVEQPRVYTVVVAEFDMNRSGAGLTWDYFYPGEKRPLFIDYIEDRDLWRKRLKGVDEFTFALRSYPHDFDVWDKLIGGSVGALVAEGDPIKRYYMRRVQEMKKNAYTATFRVTYDSTVFCRVVNVPRIFASEVAGEISAESPDGVGACFFQNPDGTWEYSLRSRGGADVSKIAQAWGGGGHAKAAGFTVSSLVHTPV